MTLCRDAIRHAFSVLAIKGPKHRVSHYVCVCIMCVYIRTYVHTYMYVYSTTVRT